MCAREHRLFTTRPREQLRPGWQNLPRAREASLAPRPKHRPCESSDEWRAVAGRMSEDLLNALRALRVADPDLGLKPLAARQAAGAAARPGSGHQGGPRGADSAEGRERGCESRRRLARCRRGRRAFAGRLHSGRAGLLHGGN
eukprot:scaffold122436_cov52-Phaeocystis_antarctica.AAC.4